MRKSFATALARFLRRIMPTRLTNRYRPELHYMRGPGPKWHAKHVLGTGSTRSPSSRQQLVEQKARLKAGLFVHQRLS